MGSIGSEHCPKECSFADLRRQGGLWQITSAVRVAELAAKAVKEEIAKTNVNVPFKDFYGRQLPAVLAKLGFSAAEIGLEPASGWPSTATP